MNKLDTTSDMMEEGNGERSEASTVGCCFRWQDPDLRRDFYNFGGYKKSAIAIALVALITTASFLMNLLSSVQYVGGKGNDGPMDAFVAVEVVLAFLTFLGHWLIFAGIQFPQMFSKFSFGQMLQRKQHDLQRLIIFITTFNYGVRLIARVYVGSCEEISQYTSFEMYCNPLADADFIPVDTAVLLMMTPIVYATVFRESYLEVLLSSWLLGTMFLLISTAMILRPKCLSFIVPMSILTLIIILDTVKHNANIFLLNRHLQETLVVNEQLSKEDHKNEIRNLIGNVAHDLKTPLSSFMSGVDLISLFVSDFQETVGKAMVNSSQIETFLIQLGSSLSNIRETNVFMMMTINRCIDYTKASKGLKLTPKYETIHLGDALQLPLICMKNIQDKVSIELMPLPPSICTHMITDKQWLQENLLCLLSNAVKYSFSGKVTVSISYETQTLPPSESAASLADHFDPIVAQSLTRGSKVTPLPNSSKSFEQATVITQSTGHTSEDPSVKLHIPGFILVEVEDNGIGVPKDAMMKLFNPFKQTQKLAGGTGLGLYSLAKRVEALGGQYGVKGRKDGEQGSLFWFTIPYKPDHSFETTLNIDLQSTSGRDIPKIDWSHSFDSTEVTSTPKFNKGKTLENRTNKSLKILLVEDSILVSKVTINLLSKYKHEVKYVENGELATQAMKAILQHRKNQQHQDEILEDNSFTYYDVVLMDLQMPVMDGFEATRRIRNLEEEMNIPFEQRQLIIGLSANILSDYTSEHGNDFDYFLAKPFQLDALYDILHRRMVSTIRPAK